MSSFADPASLAATSAAVLWSLALGATLVLWTKARAAARRRRLAALDNGLTGLFRSIEEQPAPERLEMVIDTLVEHEALGVSAPEWAGRKPAAVD